MIAGGALYPAMQNMNATLPAPMPSLYKRELPDSQESYLSAASSTFSAPQLPSSSSNLSLSTTGDTELTSPASSKITFDLKPPTERLLPPSPIRARGPDAPLRIDAANAPQTGDTAASPMSLDSPVAHGFKRTADGSVKGAVISADHSARRTAAHKRNKSMESNANTRIGELSAQLKTRLSYAMVKVQNGWEKQSLEELEEHTSQRGSPISRSDGSRLTFDSPSEADRRRRPSGLSDNSDQMMISPSQSTPSDLSRSLVNTPSSYWRPGSKHTMDASVNLMTVTGSDTGTMLGPAADFSSRRKRRSSASQHPPPLLGTSDRKYYSDLGATPRTPATPRAGILRMPSQQAEKDAVDTLLFMSSPNNSSRVPHTSKDAQRFNPPARRVMFEGHPPVGKSIYKHPQHQAPSSQPAAYYRAEPPR